MNKIFNKFLIGVLFILGITLVPAFKADAGVVDVTANYQPSSLTVSSGTQVTIRWDAPWASSCYNNFNSSTSTNDQYTYTATATQTFTVDCTKPAYCSGNFDCGSIGDYDTCNSLSGSGCMLQATSPQYSCNSNSDCSYGFCNTDTYLCEICGFTYSEGSINCSVISDNEGSICQSISGCTWNP